MKNVMIVAALMSLVACGDISINGNADVDLGGGVVTHRDNLYAGPCGLWDIAGEWEGVTFSGRCQMEIDAGVVVTDYDLNWYTEQGKTAAVQESRALVSPITMTVDYPSIVDDDFDLDQNVLFDVVGTNEFNSKNESCDIQVLGGTMYVDCANFYFETKRKQ